MSKKFDKDVLKPEILRRLSEGETLTSILKTSGMPSRPEFYLWLKEPDFSQLYASAREIGFDAIADDALEIADTPVQHVETITNENGVTTKLKDAIDHRKMRIWTRLQLLAKWCPKRYGDRTAVDVGVQGDMVEALRAGRGRLKNE